MAMEVGRVYGRRVTLEEVIEFALQAHEQGAWPVTEPVDDHSAPSLARRWGPPSHGTALFTCLRCHLTWQYGATGEIVLPPRQRVHEALIHADRITWLPNGCTDHPPHPGDVELPDRKLREQVVAEDGGCQVPGCIHGKGGTPAPLQALPVELLVGATEPPFMAGEPERPLLSICIPHLRALLRNRMQLRVETDGTLLFDNLGEPPPGRHTPAWHSLRGSRRLAASCNLPHLLQEVDRRTFDAEEVGEQLYWAYEEALVDPPVDDLPPPF
jgi:hypothetical protein